MKAGKQAIGLFDFLQLKTTYRVVVAGCDTTIVGRLHDIVENSDFLIFANEIGNEFIINVRHIAYIVEIS